MQQLWVEKIISKLCFQQLPVQVRNIKSKKILSREEKKQMMAYVSHELLNKTPVQSSTASIGDTENVEVEDNETKIEIEENGLIQ